GDDTHRSSDGIAVRLGSDKPEANAAISTELVIPVQVSGAVVRSQQQVEVAITIEVPIGQPAANLRPLEPSSKLGGDIAKLACTIVQKQKRWLSIAHVATNVAHGFVDVSVRHGKVKPAVQVGIEKNTSEAQAILGSPAHAGLRRDVFVIFPGEFVQACHLVIEVGNGHARPA